MRRLLLVGLLVLAVGCDGGERAGDVGSSADTRATDDGFSADGSDGSEAARDASTASAIARFDVAASGPMSFDELPFPSDLHLGSDGTVNLAEMPGPGAGTELYEEWRKVLNGRGGFCTRCNAYFPIDKRFDPSSLPEDADPGDRASPDAPVVMIDADPDSPERGRLIPVRTEWQPDAGRLAVAPVRGTTLHRKRRYAVALTNQLEAEDGSPLAAAETFAKLRDAATGGGTAVGRAREVVAPALDELESAGVERSSIVSAAVFTTDDVTRLLRSTRRAVHAGPPPEVVGIDRVYSAQNGTLEDLFGTTKAADPKPGVVEAAANDPGERAVAHDDIASVVIGRARLPRVRTGKEKEVGRPNRDRDGGVVAERRDEVPFVLAVPQVQDVSKLPVSVVAAHVGRVIPMVFTDTLAERGIATLAFDLPLRGQRAESGKDTKRNLRGIDGADGLWLDSTTQVETKIVGLSSSLEMAGLPDYPLGTLLQIEADIMGMVRLLREGDIGEIRKQAPGLANLGFDADEILVHGRHLGGGRAAAVLAAEPHIAGASFGVSQASFTETYLLAPKYRPAILEAVLPALSLQQSFDGEENRALMHPVVDFYRWTLDPVDPRALAPYVLRDPVVSGKPPDVMWLAARYDQLNSTLAVEPLLANLGLETLGGTFEYAPLVSAEPPVGGNRMANGEPVTAGAYMLGAQQRLDYRHEGEVKWKPPLEPPFERYTPAKVVDSPIEDFHRLLGEFAESVVDGNATIPKR